jgi:hypothetical protein
MCAVEFPIKLMLLTVIAAESTISTADLVVRPSRYVAQLAESNSEERPAYGRITGRVSRPG